MFKPAFYTREWRTNNRSSVQLVVAKNPTWEVAVEPYVYRTLHDIMNNPGPQILPPGAPPPTRVAPELRVQIGVVNTRTQRMAHLATLHEGLGLRTRTFYNQVAPEGSGAHYKDVLGLPDEAEFLGFSGELHLPSNLGTGNPTHILDAILVGTSRTDKAAVVHHSFSEIRIGPLFNFAHATVEGHPAASEDDFINFLDLKLGMFREGSRPDFGAQAL